VLCGPLEPLEQFRPENPLIFLELVLVQFAFKLVFTKMPENADLEHEVIIARSAIDRQKCLDIVSNLVHNIRSMHSKQS
jgi:hypothetical protein